MVVFHKKVPYSNCNSTPMKSLLQQLQEDAYLHSLPNKEIVRHCPIKILLQMKRFWLRKQNKTNLILIQTKNILIKEFNF